LIISFPLRFQNAATVPPNAMVSDRCQPPMMLNSSLSESAGSRALHALVRLFLRYILEATRREIKNELVFKTIGRVFVPVSGNSYLKTTTG